MRLLLLVVAPIRGAVRCHVTRCGLVVRLFIGFVLLGHEQRAQAGCQATSERSDACAAMTTRLPVGPAGGGGVVRLAVVGVGGLFLPAS